MMLPPNEYLAQKLTPYPLPTKDGGVLRTIGDVRAYTQGTAEDPQAAPPLAARLSSTPGGSRCGSVDATGSSRAVHGR
jgi:hypothetical protein